MKRLPVTDYPFLADQELLAEDWLSKIDKKIGIISKPKTLNK